MGVSDETMGPIMAGVFGATGSRHAMIVHADDGLDELSVTSPSSVLEVTGDGSGEYEVRDWRIDPAALGFPRATLEDLRGGDASFNRHPCHSDGARRGARCPADIGVLNAAAALMVAGRVPDLASGVELATESVDGGHALGVLDALVATSRSRRSPADGLTTPQASRRVRTRGPGGRAGFAQCEHAAAEAAAGHAAPRTPGCTSSSSTSSSTAGSETL